MANEVAKIEDYTALDNAIGHNMEGDPLRFKDGGYVRGFDKVEVKVGTRLLLHPASTSDGFIKWEDGKPVDFRLRELNNSSQLPIFRDQLGDMDESEWPKGEDPWAFTMMIAMKDEDGILLTFSTGSVGGKNALRRVLQSWRLARHKHPGMVPVVELGVGSYEHKVHRTTVEFPIFTIVDWGSWDCDDVPALTAPEQKSAALRDELNDDLPAWAKA